MAGAWVRVGGLAAIGLLVAACNHELPPPPAGGGGGGIPAGGFDAGATAGASGTSGPSRPGPNATCSNGMSDDCVDSCSSGPGVQVYPESAYCDTTGAVACTDGKVKLSSCAPDSCARTVWTCCNETTGLAAYPPCTPDGRQQPCPAGSHTWDNQADCIPTSLGVTDCGVLKGAACGGSPDRCDSRTSTTDTVCVCLPLGVSPGGGTWQCETFTTLI